jgi:hypothetical protein
MGEPYSEEQLKQQSERDKAVKPYEWTDGHGNKQKREFTQREAQDRQREMERRMRKTRQLAAGYKAGGNGGEYKAQKLKFRNQRKEYERFSEAMGLRTQMNRVTVDGLKI